MRSIAKPDLDIRRVLDELGSGLEVKNLRRLESELVEGEEEFTSNAIGGDFRLTAQKHPSIDPPDEDDVQWAWKNRFSSGVGRDMYDALKSGAGSRCPSCLHGRVHDLDHFLPKSKYPRLALVPLNLVPICSDCNGIKRAYVAKSAANEPIHPYFDDLGDEEWLVATVLEAPGAPLQFEVSPPAAWNATLGSRVAEQFKRLKLGALYADLASTLIGNLASGLDTRFAASGPAGAKRWLEEMLGTWKASNSEPYSIAALAAWSSSPFVWNGGWRVER
ncbi:HNH endonuclease [Curtobacterium sp. MCBA15_013]|uniref:HNH endonuclease n=1 Tax=Curtobacterium sp. MCBA15_013 TaxID=1898739 RepID=UPI001113B24A|nr:hypothetical protein [Curtobacterium sp. MCBA15_013]